MVEAEDSISLSPDDCARRHNRDASLDLVYHRAAMDRACPAQ
jgi:hypothetical protein